MLNNHKDELFMQRALQLAKLAEADGEIPVGAVLVKDNQVIAEGWNQSIKLHDPSAHAEMMAIRQAGKMQQNYRLVGSTLYVSLEPCPMCAGLLVHARISRLVFGARDQKTGACGTVMDLARNEHLNHLIDVTAGVLENECSHLLSAFFRSRRAIKKLEKQQKREANDSSD